MNKKTGLRIVWLKKTRSHHLVVMLSHIKEEHIWLLESLIFAVQTEMLVSCKLQGFVLLIWLLKPSFPWRYVMQFSVISSKLVKMSIFNAIFWRFQATSDALKYTKRLLSIYTFILMHFYWFSGTLIFDRNFLISPYGCKGKFSILTNFKIPPKKRDILLRHILAKSNRIIKLLLPETFILKLQANILDFSSENWNFTFG